MAMQGELFTGETTPRSGQRTGGPHAVPEPAPVWLQRLSLVVLVMFCFCIGAWQTILPWSPRYFDSNGWLLAHPAIAAFLGRSWMRGILSGIGLIDIWIGVSELLNYRDYKTE
jgi:hypothetical protein